MNKIAVFADVHICEEYYETIKKPLEYFIEYVRENKIDTVCLAGDYFEKRLNADSFSYKWGISKLGELSTLVNNLIILRGTFSHDHDSLDIISTISQFWPSKTNIVYAKTKEVIELEGKKILLLPEEYPEDPEEYYKEVLNDNYDYIFGHGDIQGAVLHSGIDNRRLKGFRFSPTRFSSISKQTVFGHIHKHQFLADNVSYPGSLARNKYGEEEDKGFLVIDCESNNIEFVVTPTTIFKTIVLEEGLTESELEEIKSKYENLKIKVNKNNIDLSTELKETLKNMDIKVSLDFVGETISSEILFEDIENKDIVSQYLTILEKDIEGGKFAKKHLSYFNEETISKIVSDMIKIEDKKEEL